MRRENRVGWRVAGISLAATLAITIVPLGAAHAEETGLDTIEVLETLTARDDGRFGEATNVLVDVSSDASVETDGSVVASEGGVDVKIPADTGSRLQLGEVGVLLPFSEEAADAEVLEPGVVEFENGNDTKTVPVVKDDGSVQVATIIESAEAPQEYVYELELPADAVVTTGDSGVVLVTRGDSLLLGIAAPWAVDASGASVPTHYELRDDLLVQIVDHTSASFAYPVVADPWLGAALFGAVSQNKTTQKISGSTTAWGTSVQTGVAVGGWGIGQTIMKTAGWDEWANKAPLSRSKNTYRQQFDCHVLGAYTPVTGGTSWDLEGTRANRPNWAVDGGAYPLKCNWP